MLCIISLFTGLIPKTDSFELLQPDYIESLGFNSSSVPHWSAYMHNNLLSTISMYYCKDAGDVYCERNAQAHLICKIQRT